MKSRTKVLVHSLLVPVSHAQNMQTVGKKCKQKQQLLHMQCSYLGPEKNSPGHSCHKNTPKNILEEVP